MSQRRGRGEGSLSFDQRRNLWVGQLDLGVDGAGKRQRRRVYGKTKSEARVKLAVLRKSVDAGLPPGKARTTVGHTLDAWLARGLRASVRSQATRDNYGWAVRVHLAPRLGARKLRELSPDHVADALAEMQAAGLSTRSLRLIHQVLTQALRWAERRGEVARNVATLVDAPTGGSRPSRSLTEEQARALLESARGERLEALVILGLMIGMRPGELAGLGWDAVDLDTGILEIRQSLHRVGNQLILGEPKTPGSRRRIGLPAPAVTALRAHRVRQAAERLAAGEVWIDSRLVFTSEIGTPIDPSNLRRSFARLTRKAGLGHWHPHELRHSATSILHAAGVPIEVISDLLGHTGTRITNEVYRHIISDTIDAAVVPMEALFPAAG